MAVPRFRHDFFTIRTAGPPDTLDVRRATDNSCFSTQRSRFRGSCRSRTTSGFQCRADGSLRSARGVRSSRAILSALGIYGVTAYSVAQRTREIGISIALGAQPKGSFCAYLLRQWVVLVVFGVAMGGRCLAALTRFPRKHAVRREIQRSANACECGVSLMGVAALACWIPARRAMRPRSDRGLRSE